MFLALWAQEGAGKLGSTATIAEFVPPPVAVLPNFPVPSCAKSARNIVFGFELHRNRSQCGRGKGARAIECHFAQFAFGPGRY